MHELRPVTGWSFFDTIQSRAKESIGDAILGRIVVVRSTKQFVGIKVEGF